ncbi:MAG: DUF2461 domain-containing protein [Methanothrix sp.]
MTQFTPIFAFLRDLRENNNHEWFAAHRPEYDHAKALFEDFIQGLIFRFDAVEPLGDLAAKDAIFRIHNDMRFAKNKPPYKNHFSAVLAPGGRHSLRLPYYIHIMPGGSILAGGAHMPTSADLQAIRAAIVEDPGPIKKVIEAPEFQKYFGEVSGEMLKTAPRGYAPDQPQIELLRHKQFLVVHQLSDERVLEPDFADHALQVFAAMKPFFDYLQPLVGTQMRPARISPKKKSEQGMKKERI